MVEKERMMNQSANAPLGTFSVITRQDSPCRNRISASLDVHRSAREGKEKQKVESKKVSELVPRRRGLAHGKRES